MSLVSITALVTRSDLGLSDLDINDEVNYFVVPNIDPGAVMWDREQVQSRFIHGTVTVGRKKQTIDYGLPIDVVGSSFAALTAAKTELIKAFEQDTFQVRMVFDGVEYRWQCEAADYSVSWDHAFIHNRRLQMRFSFPRQPIPLLGV